MLCTATRLGPPRCPTNHELRDSPSSPLALLSSSLPSLLLPLNSAGLLGLEYKESPTRTCVCVCTWMCKLAGCLVYTRACVLCVHTCIHVGWCACMHAWWCLCVQMCIVLCVHMQMGQCACMHACTVPCVHACMPFLCTRASCLCARVHSCRYVHACARVSE